MRFHGRKNSSSVHSNVMLIQLSDVAELRQKKILVITSRRVSAPCITHDVADEEMAKRKRQEVEEKDIRPQTESSWSDLNFPAR